MISRDVIRNIATRGLVVYVAANTGNPFISIATTSSGGFLNFITAVITGTSFSYVVAVFTSDPNSISTIGTRRNLVRGMGSRPICRGFSALLNRSYAKGFVHFSTVIFAILIQQFFQLWFCLVVVFVVVVAVVFVVVVVIYST